MKLAISNIGWTNEEEPAVAEYLQSAGVKYVEIAPTKRWAEPTLASDTEINEYKQWWAKYDIAIIAFQSMLFAHPEYTVFGSDEDREITEKYLADFMVLAGKMGAERMVFGSPKNRQRGEMAVETANEVASGFFGRLGNVALDNNTVLCLEPNAPQYNCDFITTAAEGLSLVKDVDNKGFELHLDLACMTLAGDNVVESIHSAGDHLKHFHISSPMLEQVEDRPDLAHREAAQALRDVSYGGFVSIEMRPGETGTNVDRVKKAITFAQDIYS
jgi:sugar phosphate isomerase/epimerase